jgi:hypothetical protein
MRRSVVALVVAALGLLPSSAAAQNVPPGNSEVEQYFETVPSGSGNAPPARSGPGAPSAAPLPEKARRKLAALGPDGQAVIELAEGNGAPPTPKRRLDATDGGGGLLPALGDALTGSRDGGLGVMLPLLLLATLVAGVAVGLRRRGTS